MRSSIKEVSQKNSSEEAGKAARCIWGAQGGFTEEAALQWGPQQCVSPQGWAPPLTQNCTQGNGCYTDKWNLSSLGQTRGKETLERNTGRRHASLCDVLLNSLERALSYANNVHLLDSPWGCQIVGGGRTSSRSMHITLVKMRQN